MSSSTQSFDACSGTGLDVDPSPMLEAVRLARRGAWATAPNPTVGAVLTLDGEIVARGWHRYYGKPHAEVDALADARSKGVELERCTIWVTLEPCNHFGKTPPCTQAILDAGIKKVVVGALDPNPDVQGGGVARLREHGVEVETGVAAQECQDLIADFKAWKLEARPCVILKLAGTLDGRIATRTGHSRWVSGEASRQRVHELRRNVQAVMVGGETFRLDNPQLTCRLGSSDAARESDTPPSGHNALRRPLALVVTSRLPGVEGTLPCLLQERPADVIFLTGNEQAASSAARALEGLGCKVWGLDTTTEGRLDLRAGLRRLYKEFPCYYLLCEGGGSLGRSLLEDGLVDEFQLYLAPKLLADNQAKPLFTGRATQSMEDTLGLRIAATERVGEDLLVSLRPLVKTTER